jgi:hypothetical protein
MKSLSRLLGFIVLTALLPLNAQIPQEKINALDQALSASKSESSAARQRLSVKRAVRDAEELFKANPTAANRFVLLEVLFRARQELVKLDNDPENRTALLETCKLLAAAPDEFALQRFDADLLLSQSESARQGKDTNARTKALLALADRYRGTNAEAKSLKVAIVIAMELGDTQIAETLRSRIEERFAADLDMIEFQRQHFGGQVIAAPLAGSFPCADGKWLRFPMDAFGKSTMILFWSNDETGKKHLAGFAAAQKELPPEATGRLQLISCNVDELPDAGQSILKEMAIAWPAMKLPGGKENPYYKTFILNSSSVLTLSPTGYAALILQGSTRNNNGRNVELTGETDYNRWLGSTLSRGWTQPLYMSQLTYLHSGEFLLHGQTASAIQQCFLPPILRFHTPNTELIALYQKADDLSAKAIAATASAPDLWLLRNQRITALNALWKLTGERSHLDRALEESQAALAANPSPAASVIPRFTLTREALRQPAAKHRDIIAAFLNTLGGDKAPATALTAASLLALETADRELHETYRTKILAAHANDPSIAPAVALLLNRSHRYWLHQVPFSAGWSFGRREQYFLTLGESEDAKRPFLGELKSLTGNTVSLPKEHLGKWLIVLIPSTKAHEKIPLAKIIPNELNHYKRHLTDKRGNDDLAIITALLDDDAARATARYATADITCPVTLIPGGIGNPLVAQLGIIDEPGGCNIILVKPDGTIAVVLPGNSRHNASIPNIIEWHDKQAVLDAIARGDIEAAKHIAFRHAPTEPPVSTDPKKKNIKLPPTGRDHLRARAHVYLAMKEYDKALADAQEALSQERGAAGGMSLRTKALAEDEALVARIQQERAP